MYVVVKASCGMIYVPGFNMTRTGVQIILRFYFSNVRGCDVGINDRWICEVHR
jgi:hypothetical protein